MGWSLSWLLSAPGLGEVYQYYVEGPNATVDRSQDRRDGVDGSAHAPGLGPAPACSRACRA